MASLRFVFDGKELARYSLIAVSATKAIEMIRASESANELSRHRAATFVAPFRARCACPRFALSVCSAGRISVHRRLSCSCSALSPVATTMGPKDDLRCTSPGVTSNRKDLQQSSPGCTGLSQDKEWNYSGNGVSCKVGVVLTCCVEIDLQAYGKQL